MNKYTGIDTRVLGIRAHANQVRYPGTVLYPVHARTVPVTGWWVGGERYDTRVHTGYRTVQGIILRYDLSTGIGAQYSYAPH